MKRKVFALVLSLLVAVTALAGCNSGDGKTTSGTAGGNDTKSDYPTKPIQVIIPYAPGGGSDILTRAIMQYIELPNNTKLVAVNVEGAAGYTGCQQAANAVNDGYNILAHNPMDVVSYTLNGTTSQELWTELEMIACVVDDFNVVSTNKQSGWTTLDEAVEYIKAHPGEVKWGCTGSLNVNYADTLRVIRELGIEDDVTIVPYDGGSASKTALMGNHIQMETNSSSDIRTSIESGDTIPLMVIGDRRAGALPDVACSEEMGYDVQTTKPRGYYAPAGTSQEVIDILADAIEKVCENEEFQKSVADLGLEVNFARSEEMNKKLSEWVEELKPLFEEMSQQ